MRKKDQGSGQTNQRQHEIEDAAWRSTGFERHLASPLLDQKRSANRAAWAAAAQDAIP